MAKKQTKAMKKKEVTKMNNESVKPLKVRFCPQCKATNVGFVFRLQNIFGLLPRVECYECGHFGSEFPLLVVTKNDLEKREKQKMKKKTVTAKKKTKSVRKKQ